MQLVNASHKLLLNCEISNDVVLVVSTNLVMILYHIRVMTKNVKKMMIIQIVNMNWMWKAETRYEKNVSGKLWFKIVLGFERFSLKDFWHKSYERFFSFLIPQIFVAFRLKVFLASIDAFGLNPIDYKFRNKCCDLSYGY